MSSNLQGCGDCRRKRSAVDTLRYRLIEPVLPAVEAWLAGSPQKTARAVAMRSLEAQSKEIARMAEHGRSAETKRIAVALLPLLAAKNEALGSPLK